MRILLVGGGTGGPVAPLLALVQEIKKDHPKTKFLFVGSDQGPAKIMAENAKIEYVNIIAGKWRRYFSLKNILTVFQVLAGFVQSFKILNNFKPDCIVGAGAFAQVPVVWAGFFKRIPSLIHQQDIIPGLANRICQLPAKKITVCFETTAKDFISHVGLFYKKQRIDKIVVIGNPIRLNLKGVDKKSALKYFNLHENLPVLFVIGGGTGAAFLNNLINDSMPDLAKTVQILHVTGLKKGLDIKHQNYRSFEFINNTEHAFVAADIVLCRAGISTMAELSYLKKVAVVVPIPNSHQEFNASFLYSQKAAVVLSQKQLNHKNLQQLIKKILFNHELQKVLQKNIEKIMPHNANKKIAEFVIKLSQKNEK